MVEFQYAIPSIPSGSLYLRREPIGVGASKIGLGKGSSDQDEYQRRLDLFSLGGDNTPDLMGSSGPQRRIFCQSTG